MLGVGILARLLGQRIVKPRLLADQRQKERSVTMTTKPGTIYRKTDLVGTSNQGYDDAIKRALERAHQTLRQLKWFEVTGQRGRIRDGAIEYQVELEVGFALEYTLA